MKSKSALNIAPPILFMIFAILLSGCTTYIKSTPVQVSDRSLVHEGILYSLPMLQYEIDATWQVISCDAPVDILFTLDVKENFIPDPGFIFKIDYTELAGILNTSTGDIDLYDNGTLKSFNVEVNDRSAEILPKLFSIFSAIPAVSPEESQPESANGCLL